MVATVLVLGVLLAGQGIPRLQELVGASLLVPSLAALVLLWRRADQDPAERRGWRLQAAGVAFSCVSLAVMALFPQQAAEGGPTAWLYLATNVLFHLFTIAGLLSFPWRPPRERSRPMQALGSVLFIGSLLLLLWLAGTLRAAMARPTLLNAALIGTCVRLSLAGGVMLYLLTEDLRRVKGPLGWQAAAVLLVLPVSALLQTLLATGGVPQSLFAIVAAGPFLIAVSAWSRQPVEPAPETPAPERAWGLLVYLPYLAAGATLGYAHLAAPDLLSGPTLLFLLLTGLLVARQFLLLREVSRARDDLDARVRERTRDLETAQGALIRTERLNTLASLGAGIAHDLNNALAVIRTGTENLGRERELGQLPDPQELADMATAAGQAAALTGRLMRFVRREAEVPAPLDLKALAGELEGLLRMVAGRRVTLSLEAGEAPLHVRTTRGRLEQILVNLVGNARDALEAGGRVTLRLRAVVGPEGPRVLLQVQDDGAGMAPEVQAHLFEPFFTTKAEGRGTGLGLYSVKALVESDGGRILVDSAPGRGTVVSVDYPAEPAPTA